MQELNAEPRNECNLTVDYVAKVTGCWTTFDSAVLDELSDYHVWTEDFLDSRLRWRPKQPITVLELRCSVLQQPLTVPNKESYWGCFSWVDLDLRLTQEALQSAQPVLSDEEFCERQQGVRTALKKLKQYDEVKVPVAAG